MPGASNLAVLGVFSLLSVLAVGGGSAVLPEMKALVVESRHWLTEDQFRDLFGIGQMAPGPNMLMVILIGLHVTGAPGAVLAFVGFFLPSSAISLGVSRIWDRFENNPWRASLQRGLAPLVVGLMASGVVAIARIAAAEARTAALAAACGLCVLVLRRVNPALFVLAGGLIEIFARLR